MIPGTVAAAGDLDGDGFADLAAGDPPLDGEGRVRIFRGDPAIDDVADLELAGSSRRFGSALTYLPSFGADGAVLVIGEPGSACSDPRAQRAAKLGTSIASCRWARPRHADAAVGRCISRADLPRSGA